MNKTVKQYLQPAFLICLAVLLLAGWLISAVQSEKGLKIPFKKERIKFMFVKEPIPPKKPMDQMDGSKLKPFEVLGKSRILDKDIVKSLGTEEYLQWTILNPDSPPDSPVRIFTLFITYYEKPDSVPHVPEECYSGGGFKQESSKAITFEVQNQNDSLIKQRKIPGRYVTFSKAGGGLKDNTGFPVLYFLNVNGEYVNTRTEARLALAKNIRRKHSYFSKVEFVFNKTGKMPKKDDAIRTCEKILKVLLPPLEMEHWPDRKQLN